MGDGVRLKLKCLCARCRINKWAVDFKEGSAANISSKSICLACEQGEKISKLENAMREKDIEIKKMKDIISKLEKKMEEINGTEKKVDEDKSGEESTSSISIEGKQSLNEKIAILSDIVKENRDTVVESGKEIVKIRQEMETMKTNQEFQVASGRRVAGRVRSVSWRGVPVTNRFSVLSKEETYKVTQ